MTDPKTEENENPEVEPDTTAQTPPPADAPEVEPEQIAPEGTPATLGNRVLAVIIDGLIAGVLWPILTPIGPLVGIAYILTRDALPFLDGQSIGKKAMKLRAVSTETGKPLTNDWQASVIRNVNLAIPGIGGVFAIIELIVLSNNKDNQRLGDQWAKTKVIVEG